MHSIVLSYYTLTILQSYAAIRHLYQAHPQIFLFLFGLLASNFDKIQASNFLPVSGRSREFGMGWDSVFGCQKLNGQNRII